MNSELSDLGEKIDKVDRFYAERVKKLDDFYAQRIDALLERIEVLENRITDFATRLESFERAKT